MQYKLRGVHTSFPHTLHARKKNVNKLLQLGDTQICRQLLTATIVIIVPYCASFVLIYMYQY